MHRGKLFNVLYIVKGVTYELVNIKLFGVIDGTVDLNKLHYTHKTKTKIHNTFTKKKKSCVYNYEDF